MQGELDPNSGTYVTAVVISVSILKVKSAQYHNRARLGTISIRVVSHPPISSRTWRKVKLKHQQLTDEIDKTYIDISNSSTAK